MVVFSKNYASSSWFLEELVKILDCKEKLKQIIDPSQVRKKIGCFGEDLGIQKERFFGDLQNVADMHGSEFIGNIIEQVLLEVNQTPLDIAWYPVGVDTHVKDIELLSQNEGVDEVHMVGKFGIGGIGKIALAKSIKLFKARLGPKKVLIVLDDVDHRRQLESLTRERSWFGSGSLIIITTRDEYLMYGLRADDANSRLEEDLGSKEM
ncbi:TMV resistance protein N-like [Lycium barbarum]|uniref:TMV resistance protein N-like n=1 Tax=Lycium barbarum TaxID=112863 RepID=UPI00293F4B68|nr:TMV resistance protein N-like [Lycium barbarum]